MDRRLLFDCTALDHPDHDFPRELRRADRTIVLVSIVLAVINGTLEEVLWRGTYLVVFRENIWLALIYPSLSWPPRRPVR